MVEVKGKEWDEDGHKVSTVYLVSIHVSVNIYNGECCCGRSSIPKQTTRNYFRSRNASVVAMRQNLWETVYNIATTFLNEPFSGSYT